MKLSQLLITTFLVTLTLSGCSRFAKKTEEPTTKPPINEPVNVIDISQRPFVTLTPRSDGKELTLTLSTLPQSAQEAEYELEYQAGTLLQSTFGSLDLANPSLPLSVKTLLGSCSAGGACSFHEDVQGGSLLMKFRSDPNYVLKGQWRFQDTTEAEGNFGSSDAKFKLSTGNIFNSLGYLIIMDTLGLPQELPATVITGPYGVFAPSQLPNQEIDVSIRVSQDTASPKLFGWDGSAWVQLESSFADKQVSATTTPFSVFVVTE